jgi:hypothetical protein
MARVMFGYAGVASLQLLTEANPSPSTIKVVAAEAGKGVITSATAKIASTTENLRMVAPIVIPRAPWVYHIGFRRNPPGGQTPSRLLRLGLGVWQHGSMPVLEMSTVVAVPNQVSSSLGEEAVILELTHGIYYGLNEVGARIWELLKKPRKAGEIRDVILDEYEVEPQAVTRDVLGLLTELADRGLIEVRDGKAP